jgi:hypothetical protein
LTNHVVFNETVSQLDNDRYWLYGVDDPELHEFPYIELESILLKFLLTCTHTN